MSYILAHANNWYTASSNTNNDRVTVNVFSQSIKPEMTPNSDVRDKNSYRRLKCVGVNAEFYFLRRNIIVKVLILYCEYYKL